jgi:hypothetical protein
LGAEHGPPVHAARRLALMQVGRRGVQVVQLVGVQPRHLGPRPGAGVLLPALRVGQARRRAGAPTWPHPSWRAVCPWPPGGAAARLAASPAPWPWDPPKLHAAPRPASAAPWLPSPRSPCAPWSPDALKQWSQGLKACVQEASGVSTRDGSKVREGFEGPLTSNNQTHTHTHTHSPLPPCPQAHDLFDEVLVTPHLDDGTKTGGWRNMLLFDPLQKDK